VRLPDGTRHRERVKSPVQSSSRGTTSEHDHAEQRAEHQRGANRAVLLTNPGPPAPPQR